MGSYTPGAGGASGFLRGNLPRSIEARVERAPGRSLESEDHAAANGRGVVLGLSACAANGELVQHGRQRRRHVRGDALVAGSTRVETIVEHHPVDAPHALHEERDMVELELLGETGVERLEGGHVVAAEARRETDAEQEHAHARGARARGDLAQAALDLARILAAQAVVAAELEHEHVRGLFQQPVEPPQSARAGVAAHAGVDELERTPLGREPALQHGREGLGRIEVQTRRDAVAEEHDLGRAGGDRRGGRRAARAGRRARQGLLRRERGRARTVLAPTAGCGHEPERERAEEREPSAGASHDRDCTRSRGTAHPPREPARRAGGQRPNPFPSGARIVHRLAAMDGGRLECRGLAKELQSGSQRLTILAGIDLAIEAGEFVAILGPSGSGKTTLLGLLAGLDRPSAGEVWLGGRRIDDLSEDELARMRRGRVGFVFQSFQLLGNLTALENVLLPLELTDVPRARERALELLGEVGLAERLGHYPAQLSGGEQQRVALARAFASEPSVLFADEPTGNLDAETGARILLLIERLRERRGTTLVLVTHDPEVAGRADRRVHLRGGRIERIESGRAAESAAR